MKFGSYLKAQRVEGWEEWYLAYERLDGMISALATVENAGRDVGVGESGFGERVTSMSTVPNPAIEAKFEGRDITEADFFSLLEAEMDKIDKFTHEKMSEVRDLIDSLVERTTDLCGGGKNELSDSERDKLSKEAKSVGDEFLRIEKFANLNYLGFHKILKKHDKQLPATPCRRFFLTRLHQQRWIRHDYSRAFVNLSKVHSMLRGDSIQPALAKAISPSGARMERSTKMYWVRVEDISSLKHLILQHLPVWQHELETLHGDSQLINAVYFDNTQLELYHGRLDKSRESFEVRMRWFDRDEPQEIFVEQKRYYEMWDSEVSEVSVKDRFTLRPDQVLPFIAGKFTVKDKVAEMRAAGATDEEIETTSQAFLQIHAKIDAKQLEPCIRTVYRRVTYQIPGQADVRITLDTGVVMHRESPRDGPDCLSEGRWYRNPELALPADEVTRFPHAVLKVKLAQLEGEAAPSWIQDLVAGGQATYVHKFGKYVHGAAALLPDAVQVLPFWIDDESLQASITRIDNKPKTRFANDDDGELKRSAASLAASAVASAGSGTISLMKPRASIMGHAGASPAPNGYGTMSQANGDASASAVYRRGDTGAGAPGGIWNLWGLLGSPDEHNIIPLKVEPKVFLANERTYLNWLHMAVTLGSIAAGLLGMTHNGPDATSGQRGGHLIGMILLPLAISFCAYALIVFYWRGKRIRERVGEFHDECGPLVLGLLNTVALGTILGLNLVGEAPPKP